jgi:hypothetical protein
MVIVTEVKNLFSLQLVFTKLRSLMGGGALLREWSSHVKQAFEFKAPLLKFVIVSGCFSSESPGANVIKTLYGRNLLISVIS